MSLPLPLVFVATEFFLSLTPGLADPTIIAQGVRHGAKLSIRGALGALTSNQLYFFISAISVGAVLAASEFLFATALSGTTPRLLPH